MTQQHSAPPLTDAASQRLRDELDHLRREQEPTCRHRLRELEAGMGEELGLALARQELARLQQRVRELEAVLATEPAHSPPHPPGLITIGSRVVVRDASGRLQTFTLVSPLEAGITQGGVSTTSPIGAALLGRRVGDAVRVDVPAGIRTLTVIAVEE